MTTTGELVMERIELTDAQAVAVAKSAWPPIAGWPAWDEEVRIETVREVVSAINAVCIGGPVGTIRRHTDGNVAVHTGAGWIWVDIEDGDTSESAAPTGPSWHVIFTPDGEW